MKLSLTELVDVVCKSGARKARQVMTIKSRSMEEYSPAKDFYKQLRGSVIALHRSHTPKDTLDAVLFTVSDRTRRARYTLLIASYKKWLGRKKVEWFQPISGVYSHAGVTVSINPELGLDVNGIPYIIKLYFKRDPIEKQSAELIIALMEAGLTKIGSEQFAVLDVQRGKLHCGSEKPSGTLIAMINAELAYVANLWSSLDEAA